MGNAGKVDGCLPANATRFDRLGHACHSLFASFDDWRVRLRLAERLTAELAGEAAFLSAGLSQISTLETGLPDRALQQGQTADVERQYPPECLWLPQ